MYSYSRYGNASSGWRECSVPYDELMHYGVSGMKKGLNRYRDKYGRLTPEGREHYGIGKKEKKKKEYNDTGFARKVLANEGGYYALGKKAASREQKNLDRVNAKYDVKISKAKDKGKEKRVDKLKQRRKRRIDEVRLSAKAQRAANADLDNYRRHTSTAKIMLQNAVFTPVGGHAYRHARARGSSRIGSMLEGQANLKRLREDKKKYGIYTV